MTTRSMFTPMSAAVSASCATARMPRPSRDFATKRSSPIMSTMAATKISTLSTRITASKGSAITFFSNTRGNPSWLRPYRSANNSCRKSEMPMAVIRADSRGAFRLRNGR